MFQESQHKFYRSLNGEQRTPTQIPSQDEVQRFWASILSEPVPLNSGAWWIMEVQESMEEVVEEHTFKEIDTDKLEAAIKIPNWKAPGVDKIQYYYLKYLTSTHKYIAKLFDRIMKGIEPVDHITMKFALTLLALVAVAQAKNLLVDLEDNTAYNYLAKYGLPLAEKIRAAEEAASQNKIATSLTVALGTNFLFSGGTRVSTSDVVMHSGWNPTMVRNDIAMIKLASPVSTSDRIAPITLPSGSQLTETFLGDTAIASGFGLTSDGGFITANQFLSHVQLPVITNSDCSSYFSIIRDSNICTSGANGRSTCSGDSGGPLIVIRNRQPLLVGVTSFGSDLGCQVGYPAAFARVTSYMDFINQNIFTMKVLLVLTLAALVHARSVEEAPRTTAHGYIQNIAIPLAEQIEKAEATLTQNRIIGGSQSQLGQFPYQVVLGSITLFFGGTRIESRNVIMHPDYETSLVRNDVAVIYLPSSVSFSNGGIGVNQVLSYVRLNVITNNVCLLAFPLFLQNSNICTSSIGNVSTCRGDSGGPLAVIGITSFGSGLGCEASMPVAFARFALTLLALVAVAQAKNLLVDLEDNTAYDYLAKYGLPLAEKIRAAEEAASQNRIVGGSAAGPVTYQATLLTVALGTNFLFSGGTRVSTSDVVMHSGWNPRLVRNDIAMIRLPSSVSTSDRIAPITLPSGSQLTETFLNTPSGFRVGFDASNTFLPGGFITANQFLSHVQLPVITNRDCSSFFSNIQDSNICTSGANGRSTCSSDSGGPLIVIRNRQPLLVGVTSFVSDLGCQVGYPAAFARVTSYMDFINQNMLVLPPSCLTLVVRLATLRPSPGSPPTWTSSTRTWQVNCRLYCIPLCITMKVLLVLTLAALVHARSVEEAPRTTAHGYIQNIAIPLAEQIEKAEATLAQNRIIATISPISLPSGAELLDNYAGETAVASGFGVTSQNGGIAVTQFLSHVSLNVITNNVCFLAFPLYLQNSNICTSSAGNVSTCRGDSGGPLVVIGITSFGSGLGCEVGMPAVFARVSSFIDFFNQHL
ncbi:Serine protease 51 [Operophtera brumata]|uniref:Serine protease 51 n=1 Tax=Operophtera brumata TaxID=104452 RepID=A0A0L7LHX1_OPEBR|nr:Serine protease 51 [Operophtera brumata]